MTCSALSHFFQEADQIETTYDTLETRWAGLETEQRLTSNKPFAQAEKSHIYVI